MNIQKGRKRARNNKHMNIYKRVFFSFEFLNFFFLNKYKILLKVDHTPKSEN